jgi:uncharacterized protein YpmB
MKRNKYIIISILILIIIGILVISKAYYQDSGLKYSQDYIVGEANIKGDVDVTYFFSKGKEFDIGANKNGYAVFKNPEEAFEKLKTDYKEGLAAIQKEFKLLTINKLNYKSYGTYGWQVTTGSKEEKEQALFVSSFIDIYENSFNKQ